MDLYPAIDIKGGRVMRLAGAPGAPAADPLAQAEAFVAQGARWLHVVDLDRAFRTGADNTRWVRQICAVSGVAVQVGGNLVEPDWVAEAAEAGAARVVFGTAAALDEALLGRLVEVIGRDRAAVAIELRGGRVAVRGSTFDSAVAPGELVQRVVAGGVPTVVHRDLDRDGRLSGADLEGAAALGDAGARVIAAGGVGSLQEVRTARALGLDGVVVGRALYEQRFTLREALGCSG